MRLESTTSLLNQKEHVSSGKTPIFHPLPKKSENSFSGVLFLLCSGIRRVSTWTVSLIKKPSMHSIIQLLLNEKVKPAIRSKRTKRQGSVCLLQNNVRPHTAALMMATLLKLRWDVLPHPAYSPHLASSDYHLFGPMKGVFRSQEAPD
jgi:hypothetical protein